MANFTSTPSLRKMVDMTSIAALRDMTNFTSIPTLRKVVSFTSTPTLSANDTGRDVDAILSWTLLVAACLGVLWAFSPVKLRSCTTKEKLNDVRDLERASPNPPTKNLPDYKVCLPTAPGDASKASGKPKLYFIDNIKIFLTLMVVNTHTPLRSSWATDPLRLRALPAITTRS
jgi:hypothetical protein